MTGRYDLDRELGAYLEARATSQAPDGLLDAALGQIGATKRRPGWLVRDRWLAAQTTVALAWVMRGSARVALVALLVGIAVAAAVIVGSQRRLPPPFGLARPGLIVFSSSGHLFTMHPDGSGRTQLTFGPNSDYRATYSPDGTLIAYLSAVTDSQLVAQPSLQDRSIAVKVISADGQRDVTIADQLAPSAMDTITWAPDSRHLAFAAAAADPPLSLSHIYVAEADRPGATEIGEPGRAGFEPAWSPDGKQIAFKNPDPVDALWLMNAEGSNAHPLTKMSGSGFAFQIAQWSPDGVRLLFLAGDDGAHDVWTMNADGTDGRNISKSPEDEWWPTWSPDGAKVAFVRDQPLGRFVVVNPDGSEPVTLSGPFVDSNPPTWSPDATKLFGYEMANGAEVGIVVYDLSRGNPWISIRDGFDGTWQRLAK